jgi:predicted GNAT family N-acyltransferase
VTDRVERLTADALPECLALAVDRDWPPESDKWELLFDLGSVFGVRDSAGDLVGTAVVVRFDPGLAALGMVLVARRYGRRGLGRRLVTHALADADVAVTLLYATAEGRPLYEALGFATVGTLHTHEGVPVAGEAAEAAAGSRPLQPSDTRTVLDLDTIASGADRAALLGRLAAAERLRVTERDGRMTGYAGVWCGARRVLIGPLVAETVGDARALVADILRSADRPVRLDLDGEQAELREWATGQGLPSRRESPLMVLGGPPPGDRRAFFAPIFQAPG